MTKEGRTITELDSKLLYYSLISGAKRIFEHQRTLNKINVFPVADADTGTNLASTMRSIVNAPIQADTPKQAAVAIADAAISGARGNSGIIFAQFLYGFSNEMNNAPTLDINAFAESMQKAVTYAYEAIANPVEGTILTVIREWADHLYKLKDIIDDFIKLLWEAYKRALESLANTTKKLEVLARTHVVDAGAKGFVYFLEGILDFLTKGEIHEAVAEEETDVMDSVAAADLHENITHRFCTEALLTGEKIDKKLLYNTVKDLGDSLVVAGSPQKMRVHIHSDRPAELFVRLHDFGTITYQKVDDMVMQYNILHDRKADIALFTDSTCDLPGEILDRYQIHVLPLSVHFGDNYFLDRLTIQPDSFYKLLEKSETNPTSAQPAPQDLVNKCEYLATHYNAAIGIHISQAMSGTFGGSKKAAAEVEMRTGKPIHVFNSRSLTGGLGLTVLRVAQAIERKEPLEEILPKVNEWINKLELRVTVPTLKYIIRSGRVSPFKSFIAKMLDLKPVIALDENGKAEMFSKSFTTKASMKKVIRNLEKLVRDKKLWGYCITHADNPEAAGWYAREMERLTGMQPLFVSDASPVLVANTGLGVACVSLMFE